MAKKDPPYDFLDRLLAYTGKYFIGTDSLPESKHKPTISDRKNNKYYTYPGIKSDVVNNLLNSEKAKRAIQRKRLKNAPKGYNEKPYSSQFDSLHSHLKSVPNRFKTMSTESSALGHYKIDAGRDDKGRYISIHDTYDWDVLESMGLMQDDAKFETYDRIYEDEYKTKRDSLQSKRFGGKVYDKENKNSYIKPNKDSKAMPRYRKKLRRYATPPQYIGGGKLGQIIGTGVGAVGGSFLGNPMLGAKIGGMAGGAIGGAVDGEEQGVPQQPVRRAASSYGYKYGGEMKHGGRIAKEAKRRGMSVKEYARKVLDNQGDFSDAVVAEATAIQEMEHGGEYAFGGKVTTDNKSENLTLRDGGVHPEPARADTTERIPRRTTGEQQAHRYRQDMALKERLKLMEQGDYSMVGDSLQADTVQVNPNYANPQPEFAYGGVTPLGGDAVKYNGPKHEQGGIPIDGAGNPTNKNTATAEVEGGETKDGNYIFSDTLKVPKTEGRTFAEVHEMMMKRGASEKDIQKLKMLQEKVQEQEGVKGGDEQGVQPMPEGPTASNEVGKMTQRAQKVSNQGATGKNAGQPVGMRRKPTMRGGGKMNHYQSGGDLQMASVSQSDKDMYEAAKADTLGFGQSASPQAPEGGNDWLKTAADVAGYAVPSIMKGTMALTDPGVERTPRMEAETVPVQSRAFNEGERSLASGYRAMLADPSASTTEKLAAQSQYIKGRSNLAGKEAQYRSRQQQFNAQQRSTADRVNRQAFQQDREIMAKEDAARKQLLMDAVTSPINDFRRNQAGKRSQVANILVSANQIQNPTDRRNAITRGLRAMGLDDKEIQEIIAKNEAQ